MARFDGGSGRGHRALERHTRLEAACDDEGAGWVPFYDAEFFAGTNIKSNFIVSIGHGTDEGLFPRNPRLAFDEAAKIL